MNSKSLAQPTLGIVASILVIAFALAISSSFAPDVFGSWVTLILVCMVPVQIILTLYMQNSISPKFDALAQPVNGIVKTGLMAFFGLIVFAITQGLFNGIGSTPTPFSIMYSINTVITTFWLVIVFGGWPFRLIENKFVSALALLVGAMIISYLIFQVAYSFAAFKPAPFYSATLDPSGAFDAWMALCFVVTSLAVILAWILLDFFPIGPKPENPILRIVVVGSIVLAITYGVVTIGVSFVGDPVTFMVNYVIATIFGEFIVLLMLETAPVQATPQPLKGIVLISLSIIIAFVSNLLYTNVGTSTFGLTSGAPTYQIEMWVASAMLAVTFPTFVLFSQLLNFWPLRGMKVEEESEEVVAEKAKS